MHKLILLVLFLLLGLNGLFVWQNLERNKKTATNIGSVSKRASLHADNIVTFMLSEAFAINK